MRYHLPLFLIGLVLWLIILALPGDNVIGVLCALFAGGAHGLLIYDAFHPDALERLLGG